MHGSLAKRSPSGIGNGEFGCEPLREYAYALPVLLASNLVKYGGQLRDVTNLRSIALQEQQACGEWSREHIKPAAANHSAETLASAKHQVYQECNS